MKAMTLLETIGEARSKYVQKAGLPMDMLTVSAAAPHRRLHFKKPLLIAAVLMALLLGACAAAANWFVSYYQARTPITEDQIQYIEAHTEKQNQAITMDGYEIELFNVMADSSQLHLAFVITGPETVNLEEMGQELYLELDVKDSNGSYDGYHRFGVEPDNDGKANTQVYFYQVNTEGKTGANWQVHVDRICHKYRDAAYEEELLTTKYKGQTDVIFTDEETDRIQKTDILAEGPWDFTVTLNPDAEEIQFVQEPVTIHAEVSQYDGESREEDVKLTSFRLYPSGAELKFEIKGMLMYESFPYAVAVMKDDSEIKLDVSDGDAEGLMHLSAASPILLNQVAKIVLPDGTVLEK